MHSQAMLFNIQQLHFAALCCTLQVLRISDMIAQQQEIDTQQDAAGGNDSAQSTDQPAAAQAAVAASAGPVPVLGQSNAKDAFTAFSK